MPRFAANLGFSPLEPMKTSLAPTAATTLSATVQSGSGTKSTGSTDIPDVQFDWTSSGLVNPLDGMRILFYSLNRYILGLKVI